MTDGIFNAVLYVVCGYRCLPNNIFHIMVVVLASRTAANAVYLLLTFLTCRVYTFLVLVHVCFLQLLPIIAIANFEIGVT